MRAFLSHSSKDKGFVEPVADLLRPGTFELDSETFDAGLLNAQAILRALQRSDLFCLFLSRDSANSAYVDFEQQIAVELLASGKIDRFLTICLDEHALEFASSTARLFNVARRVSTPEVAARLIQGALVSAAAIESASSHPFIGREAELVELERQITSNDRPATKAIFLSGNFGSGRRTVARKFYQNQYPQVTQVFPTIKIEQFAGLEELYRGFLGTLRPSMTAQQLLSQVKGFQVAGNDEKRRLIADLLNSLAAGREAAFLFDVGGMLTDSGSLEPDIDQIVARLNPKPNPPAILIAPRMIPLRLRRAENDVAHVAIRSLSRESTERLISRLLKDRDIAASTTEISNLVDLSDGHPFNVYRIFEEIAQAGLKAFLANPSSFIDWKHRQSSEYLNKVSLDELDIGILALLKLVPELDFDALVSALQEDAGPVGDALLKLTNLHILEAVHDRFTVSPPLRIAVERDRRVRLPTERQQRAVRSVAQSLSMRLEEGTAPISLVNSAVLATLESGETLSNLAAAFLLPSHYVWLAKAHYDQKSWQESLRLSREALRGEERLSNSGLVAACRIMCLSAARLGDDETFRHGIERLERLAQDDWAKSNVAFLKGFTARLKGSLPVAEAYFREAYRLSPGNISAAREIAAISLVREKLDEAEKFAREAYGQAGNNPYVIDILIAVLIRKQGRDAKGDTEITEMFGLLEKVGEEHGRSFYTTRRAEFEHLWGSNKLARQLIEEAISKTPSIFEPHRIYAEILLKEGNKTKARDELNAMREIVNSRDPNHERRRNYRAYLQTYAKYLTEVGQYKEAKAVFDDPQVFTDEEREKAVRDIEIVQSYAKRRR